MKERIYQLMKESGMNQKEFSQATGIATATLSNIFNGRTSATLNHAFALHQKFPNLRMEWLMFGEGDMYDNNSASSIEPSAGSRNSAPLSAPNLFEDIQVQHAESALLSEDSERLRDKGANVSPSTVSVVPVQEVVKYVDKPKRKILEIRVFFDDGTFETFSAS